MALLPFYQKHGFYDVVVSKISVDRGLLVHLPDTYALVIRAAGHEFVIRSDDNVSHPFFVSVVGSSVETSADFPEFDSFVTRTADQEVPVHDKIDVAYIMVVAVESFAANIVVV